MQCQRIANVAHRVVCEVQGPHVIDHLPVLQLRVLIISALHTHL